MPDADLRRVRALGRARLQLPMRGAWSMSGWPVDTRMLRVTWRIDRQSKDSDDLECEVVVEGAVHFLIGLLVSGNATITGLEIVDGDA